MSHLGPNVSGQRPKLPRELKPQPSEPRPINPRAGGFWDSYQYGADDQRPDAVPQPTKRAPLT